MPLGRGSAWDTPPSSGTAASRTPFGDGQIRPPRRGGSILVVALALSLSMHLGFVIAAAISQLGEEEKPAEAHTFEIVDASELNYRPPAMPLVDLPADSEHVEQDPERPKDGQIVSLPAPQTRETAPDDARFRAEHDHRADEETRARDTALSPGVLASEYRGLGKDESVGDAPTQGKSENVGESDGSEDQTTGSKTVPKERRIDEMLREDPFGIRARPRVADQSESRHSTVAQGDVQRLAAGNGAKVAMAGAPNNDYLPGIREGNSTVLNAKRDRFASFYNRVTAQVESFWVTNLRESRPLGLQHKSYRTTVNIVLSANGDLLAVEVVKSSGIPAWDRAVTEAFREAAPFLNPPPGIVAPDGKIYMDDFGWVVTVGGQQVHMYGDPRAGVMFPGVREGYGPTR